MGQIGRSAGFLLVALVMIAVGVWSMPASAHAGHGAAIPHPASQTLPAATDPVAVAVAPAGEDRADADCPLACCPGGATCIMHLVGPPGCAPALPDPGSIRFSPMPETDPKGIVGALPPRPPRAA